MTICDRVCVCVCVSSSGPLGVRLDVLRDLLRSAAKCAPAATPEAALTTTEVCETVVKPATATRACAYLELLRGRTGPDGKPLVGRANVFVSHAWRYALALVIAVLEELEASSAEPLYYWFDLVLNNQHQTEDRPFEWWCTTFKSSITAIGRVVLVMAPWHDPVPLTRAWCLWEIFSAATAEGVVLDVRLPASEKVAFQSALTTDMLGVMNTLVRVQAERAEAWNAVDRDNIFEAIEKSCGFVHLNKTVKDQLRAWLLRAAEAAAEDLLQRGEKSAEALGLFFAVGRSMQDFGNYDAALKYFRLVIEGGRALAGHDETVGAAHAYNGMAGVYLAQGDLPRALELFQKSLAIKVAKLGPEHAETAGSYNNLASVYFTMTRFAEARELYQQAIAAMTASLGAEHHHTGMAYLGLGNTHASLGQHTEALAAFTKCLEILRVAQGENHPDTASAYSAVARIQQATGHLAEALQAYDKALGIRIATLGELHPDTAVSFFSLGQLLQAGGQLEQALGCFAKSLAIRQAVLGQQHLLTGLTCSGLADVLAQLGQTAQALEAYSQALAVLLQTVGEQHVDTAMVYSHKADLLMRSDRPQEALELYRKGLDIVMATQGEQHPDVYAAHNNLGNAYRALQDPSEAQRCYAKALELAVASGTASPAVLSLLHSNLAVASLGAGDPAAALEHFEINVGLKQALTPAEAPPAARAALGDAHYNVANAAQRLGQPGKAEVHFGRAAEIYAAVHGPEHAETRDALHRRELAAAAAALQ